MLAPDGLTASDGVRVTIITDFLSDLAGTERYTATVAEALAASGVHVEVFVAEPLRDRTWADMLAAYGVAVHAPSSHTTVKRLWPRLNRHVATDRPGLILANPMGQALAQWLPAVPAGLPLPPVVGVEYSHPGLASAHWYPAALPHLIHRLDAVITTCAASQHAVREFFDYRGPAYVVPHLIRLPQTFREPALARRHLASVARLSVEKGMDYALAAVALLLRDGVDVELSIYGTGTDAERLAELAGCLGVRHRVHLRGVFHPVRELDETLFRHSIWLQPSLFESVPTTLLELAARRRVVVATAVGGIPELFDGVPGGRGLLVTPGDTRALAERVRNVLDHEDRYARTAVALRSHVLARHAPDAALARLLEVLGRHYRRSPTQVLCEYGAAGRRGEL